MISLRTAATSEASCQTCVLVDEDLELPPKDMRQSEHDVTAPSHVHKQQSATLALFANGALNAEAQEEHELDKPAVAVVLSRFP